MNRPGPAVTLINRLFLSQFRKEELDSLTRFGYQFQIEYSSSLVTVLVFNYNLKLSITTLIKAMQNKHLQKQNFKKHYILM